MSVPPPQPSSSGRRWLSLALAIGCLFAAAGVRGELQFETTNVVVSNQASIRFQSAPGIEIAHESNIDSFDVLRLPASAPPELTLWRLDPESAFRLPIQPCETLVGGPSGSLQLQPLPDGMTPGPNGAAEAGVRAVTVARSGAPLVLRLLHGARNVDTEVIDSVRINLTVPETGDNEQLVLRESGRNTGLFTGCIMIEADPALPFDGHLSNEPDNHAVATYPDPTAPGSPLVRQLRLDPYARAFDSATGQPINGVSITLVDDATGEPAIVRGNDEESDYPSTVITGQPAEDASGRIYSLPAGGFVFPYVTPGRYRYEVTMPERAGYRFPSQQHEEKLRDLPGAPFQLNAGSMGQPFDIGRDPTSVDIPLDPEADTLVVVKRAQSQSAAAGDLLPYRIELSSHRALNPWHDLVVTDRMPAGFRLQDGSLTLEGEPVPADLSADGRSFSLRVPSLELGIPLEIGYIARLTTPRPGPARNHVVVGSGGFDLASASSTVIVKDELQATRAHVLGRVVQADGEIPGDTGVAGVAVYLETGSMSVSDERGFFHFEGLYPGSHVVQVDTTTLPSGAELRPPHGLGSANNSPAARLLDLAPGTLWNVEFVVSMPETDEVFESSEPQAKGPEPPPKGSLPKFDRAWIESEPAGNEWLFPARGVGAASPSTRIVVKHSPAISITAHLNGKPVNPLNYDGVLTNKARTLAASIWSGVNLSEGDNVLEIIRHDSFGIERGRETRTLHYASPPVHAEYVPERSTAVADGVTRPIIAVRLIDREGHPARRGVTGRYAVSEPYQPYRDDELDLRRHAGAAPEIPTYIVADDGMAFLELEPTATSGRVRVQLDLISGEREIWADLRADRREWIVVGLAEGTAAYNTIDRHLEALDEPQEDGWTDDGRIALFARGRVRGGWLLTAAYDSSKETEIPGSLHGRIDPDAYYTVYGDESNRFENAASRSKIFVKLEREIATALYGDFTLDWGHGTFTAYNRDLHGFMGEFRGKKIRATGFQSNAGLRFVRDELPGTGLSTDYVLSQGPVIAFSERVVLQTRDPLRPDIVHSQTPLSRNIDYTVDYDRGVVRLRAPLFTLSPGGFTNFLVVRYELDDRTIGTVSGGRVEYTPHESTVIGASAVQQKDNGQSSHTAGVDAHVQVRPNLFFIGEFARSDGDSQDASHAYRAELRHAAEGGETRLFTRETGEGFGLGQLNEAATGNRQTGLEGTQRIGEKTVVRGLAYDESILGTANGRRAAEVQVEHETEHWQFRAGGIGARDSREDTNEDSLLATAGVTRRLMKGRLELRADREQSIGGQSESADFPDRTLVGAAWALNTSTKLFLEHEIADAAGRDTQWTRIGLENTPWAGGRLNGTIGRDARSGNTAYGSSFGHILRLNDHLEVEGGFEHARVDETEDPARPTLSRPLHGAGYAVLPQGSATAGYLGAHWQPDDVLYNARVEVRDEDIARQWNFLASAQAEPRNDLGLLGSIIASHRMPDETAAQTFLDVRIGAAWRPEDRPAVVLGRLDLVRTPYAGSTDPATAWKLIFNSHLNLHSGEEDQWSFHLGGKYASTALADDTIDTYTTVAAMEYRRQLNLHWDIGLHTGVLSALDAGTHQWQAGASIGRSLGDLMWVSVGYNFTGYRDEDFSAARYTDRGVYFRLRLRLDQETLAPLLRYIKEE